MLQLAKNNFALCWSVFAFFACTPKKQSQVQTESSALESKPFTACVGLQGNGLRFPSHVGVYTALLENNIEPVVSLGGSSGSIVGSVVMSMLENHSIESAQVQFQNRKLTHAQKTAVILGAIPDVINTFLFLPAFNGLRFDEWQVTPAILRFVLQSQYGNVLAGDDNARIISIEATVGQAVLLSDFARNANFNSVFQKETYIERRDEMLRLWTEWSNGVSIDGKTLFEAAALPEAKWAENPQLAKVGDRFYRLFQQDLIQERSRHNVDVWRLLLRGAKNLLNDGTLTRLLAGRKIDSLLSTKIFLPDPALLWKAYLGFGRDQSFVKLPKGMIVHSTFRRGFFTRDADGSVNSTEAVGLSELFQGYVADDFEGRPLLTELLKVRDSVASRGEGFEPYFQDGTLDFKKLAFAYPAQQVLVLRNIATNRGDKTPGFKDDGQADVLFREGRRGLAHAVAYSAGEPGPFRRLPVFLGAEDLQDNRIGISGKTVDLLPGTTDLNEKSKVKGLISFGGWSENVPLSTLAMLPSCSQATFFVSSGKPGLGNSFQEDAIRAALRGWNFFVKVWDKIGEALGRPDPDSERLVHKHFAALNANVTFSRTLVSQKVYFDGRLGVEGGWRQGAQQERHFLAGDLEFDTPSLMQGLDKVTLNAVNGRIVNDRFALMVASYQKTMANIVSGSLASHPVRSSRINAFGSKSGTDAGGDLSAGEQIYRVGSVDSINKVLEKYSKPAQ
jgi:hypothetical protein